MVVDSKVEEYMKAVGLKYVKNAQELVTGLAVRTNKQYALDVATQLNNRAKGAPSDNKSFYELKNDSLEGSVYISAAFDGGVFRHIGNFIVQNPDLFKSSVLDLGCDCGIVTCFMAQTYPESAFKGVDINPKAIDNANKLAEKLNLNNVSFECADVLSLQDGDYSLVTSFRTLLDVCEKSTKLLSRIGERSDREKNYANAFSSYAKAVSNVLADDGVFVSVERYTAEYGWLGWLMALDSEGVYSIPDKSFCMSAQDISSKKDYTVTLAGKRVSSAPLDTYNNVMSRNFKSGTGYTDALADFALYYDSNGEIEFTDVYKKDRLIRQFAFATAKSGKGMYYEADPDSRKIKYFNQKKKDRMIKDFEDKLQLYKNDEFLYKSYKI